MALRRYQHLAASPYPVGVDGYWYSIQVREILAHGRLYYPSSPLVPWLMAPVAALAGPFAGAKIVAAAGTALAALPMYLLGRRLGGGSAFGWLAAALVATSPESAYLAAEFAKNGVALTIAAAYLAMLAATLERPSWARGAAAAALLAAATLAHRTTAVLALACTAAPLAVRLWRGATTTPTQTPTTPTGPRASVVRVAALAGGLALVALAVWWAEAPERLRGLWGAADPTLPVLAAGGLVLRFGHEVPIAGAVALVTAAAAAWIAARRWRWPRPALRGWELALIAGPAALGLAAALPWLDVSDPQGLGFRLRLLAFFALAPCAAFVAGLATAALGERWRSALVHGFALGLLVARPFATEEGVVRVAPVLPAAMQAMDGTLPDDAVIVTPDRQLVFMTTWYARVPARLHAADVPLGRIWRLLPGRRLGQDIRHVLDRARHERLPGLVRPRSLAPGDLNGLVLVPEATWQWILYQLPADARRRYQHWRTI